MENNIKSYGSLKEGDLVRFVGIDPLLYVGQPNGFNKTHYYGSELKVDQLYRLRSDPFTNSSSESYYKLIKDRKEPFLFLSECTITDYYEVSNRAPLRSLNRSYPCGWFAKINMADLIPLTERKEFLKEIWCLMHSDDRLFRRLKSLTIKSKKNV